MAFQQILWIPLPGGFLDQPQTRPRLSVFVSPQLQPDANETLGAFDFADWPERLASGRVAFTVEIDGKAVTVSMAAAPAPAPESRLWTALFAADLFVRPQAQRRLSPVFGTYPEARLHDQIRGGYRRLGAASPIDPAGAQTIAAAFDDVHRARAGLSSRTSVGTERGRIASTILGANHQELTALGDRLVDLARGDVERRRVRLEAPQFVPIVPPHDDAASPFEQFVVFRQQPRGTTRRSSARADNRLDFHQLVASLGEYPELLRRLGLIVTLELDAADIPRAAPDAPRRLRVLPAFRTPLAVKTSHVTAMTAYAFEPGRLFIAAPEPGGTAAQETVSGLLDLRLAAADPSEPQFQILQVDVDAAAHQVLQLLGNVAAAGTLGDRPSDRDDLGLPALRTGGVSIARHGQAEFIHAAIVAGQRKMANLLAGGDPTLFADDLIRGYRIDVFDEASKGWRSLHAREGTFNVLAPGATAETIVDEGWVQPCIVQPTSSGDPAASGPDPMESNYARESLFLWDGWSLSVPRPATPLPLPAPPPPPPGTPPAPPAPPPLPLDVRFKVIPRTLPRLRFGHAYTFRGRMVDLAGQSLSMESATDILSSLTPAPVLPPQGGEFRFKRFEVVGPPAVVERERPSDGESTERIVLRTPGPTSARQERHIAPPKTWAQMVERLGFFDSAMGTGTNTKEMLELASRVDGAFADGPHPEDTLELPYLPDPMAAGVTLRGVPGVPAGTMGQVQSGRLVFTPTPLPATTVAEIGSLVLIDFGPTSSWPDLKPFRLRVADGSAPPEWDATARVLTIFLDKGTTVSVRLSCHLRSLDDVSLLGVASWIEEALLPASGGVNAFREQTRLGLSWMITPARELTLVHATQRPVEVPAIVAFPQPIKLIGHTFANIRGTVRVHGASTGRVDLTAEWTDPGDHSQFATTRPQPERRLAQVFPSSFPLSDGPAAPVVPGSIPEAVFDPETDVVEYLASPIEQFDRRFHDLSATIAQRKATALRKARQLPRPRPALVDMIGLLDVIRLDDVIQASPFLKRWPELAPLAEGIRLQVQQIFDAATDTPAFGEPEDEVGLIPVPILHDLEEMQRASDQVIETARQALAGVFRGRHEFGDTKHRRVTYRCVGTSRFADAFPTSGAVDLTAASAPVDVDVLSSAAPLPPGIRYVVPAFAWTRSAPDPLTRDHHRRGGMLRVYLERPWFSSGEGEMLAVVLGPDPSTPGFERVEPFVSRWGRDPLWRGAPTPTTLRPDHFLNVVEVRDGVRPQESEAPARVTLVAYRVAYDDGGQCFCDIEMDPGTSYFPFVRLALARFQPHSIPTLEMSRIVRADFAQLAPNRGVTVVTRTAGVFDVVVSGATHDAPANPAVFSDRSGTLVRISVQRRIPGTTDDAGWIEAPSGAVVTPETGVPVTGTLWKGEVRLPAAAAPGQFRMLIEELELQARLDAGPLGPSISAVPRVVFAESVEL